MKKDNNLISGVTLISLVIMITVLIILASVTISNITGNESVIKEAKTSKEVAEKSNLEERIDALIYQAEQENVNATLDEIIEKLINASIISDESKVNKETGDITTQKGYVITGKLNDYIH